MNRRTWKALVVGGLVLACTEDPTAPGRCPDFCPPGEITVVDTILTSVVALDSAFRGYSVAHSGFVLIASNVPGVIDSRPIIQFQPLGTTIRFGSDTTGHPIVGADSARLQVRIVRHDSSVRNLRLQVYRLPRALDSNTTFADLSGPFTDSLVRSVNVDSLVRTASHRDSVTRDSVAIDTSGVSVFVHLDSAQARFVAADTGQLAYGVRLVADTATTAILGSNDSPDPPLVTWFVRVDSAGTVVKVPRVMAPQFDSYVFDPPAGALDSTLAVGGMPSARTLMRITLPPHLQDSVQILRATLILVPASAAQGAPIDSFTLVAHAVVADLGGKSPLIQSSDPKDSSFFGVAPVRVGSTDTVNIEITRILRRWAADTAAPNVLMLRSGGEGVVLGEIRFQPSQHPTLRPAVHLTYAPRFPFGSP